MNECVCSGLCAPLKGSIKECLKHSTRMDWKFGSWVCEGKRGSVGHGGPNLYADDTPLDISQHVNRWAGRMIDDGSVRLINVST